MKNHMKSYMMKNTLYYIILIGMVMLMSGCKDKEDVIPVNTAPSIIGDWHYTDDELQADIYVAFNSTGAFDLYQKIGEGRHRKYTGNWSMEGNVLSGSYSDDTAWGSSYNVTFDGDSKMILTATEDSRESYTYSRESIPDEIRDGSVEVKASCDILNSQPQYRWL